jgi:hypothetical protein
MSKSRSYSFEDIQRYLQHKMTAPEMHAFERAMMDDPFLADAIEGYKRSDQQVASIHLNEIEKQLTEGKEKARVVGMHSRENSWWKVAAIIFIIISGIGISYLFFNRGNSFKSDNREMAASKPSAAETKPDTTESMKQFATPGTTPSANNTTASSKDLVHNENRKHRPARNSAEAPSASLQSMNVSKQAPGDVAKVDDEAFAKKEQMLAATQAPRSAAPMLAKGSAPVADTVQQALQGRVAGIDINTTHQKNLASATNEFVGKVTDTARNPVPGASLIAITNNQATRTNARGKFAVRGGDSTAEVAVNSKGYSGSITKLNSSSKDNSIVLQKSNSALNEVVVVGYGAKRKKGDPATVSPAEAKGLAEPVTGWNNFNNYANTQIKNFKDSVADSYEGDIDVQFSINRKGRPKNIKIQQQADKAVIEKAKDILQQWPFWKGPKRSNIKVTLHFQ